MIPLLGILAGVGGALVGKALTTFSTGTALFGNLVAVTGDAHQAQVAQDIFRADVRHELSLLVREDMRDVYALMCETVATQVTMGSICLGVCFGVFTEGYCSGAETVILELWAMFCAWAALCSLTSLLLAMWFQMSIKNAVRERLLLRHRIFTPNDTVISSLGGRTLAEQVSRLHARLVAQLVSLASFAFNVQADADSDGDLDTELGAGKTMTSVTTDATFPAAGAGVDLHGDDARHRFSATQSQTFEEEDQNPSEKTTVDVEYDNPYVDEDDALHFRDVIRAKRNVTAWYDLQSHALLRHKIVELPGFLAGGALIRQPWRTDQPETLRLRVYDEATLYVAARVKNKEQRENSEEHHASLTQLLELTRDSCQWEADEMPRAHGGHPACDYFRRVEGFSIFVNSHRVHLPLYKLVLRVPEGEDGVQVTVKWRFKAPVEALTVILREGSVLTSEDEHPKRAFMQEVEVMAPLMVFAARYIHCGTTCLLIAVLCMHCSRIFPVRPWPECAGELFALLAAACVAMAGMFSRAPLHQERLFNVEEQVKLAGGDNDAPQVKKAGETTPSFAKSLLHSFLNFRPWEWSRSQPDSSRSISSLSSSSSNGLRHRNNSDPMTPNHVHDSPMGQTPRTTRTTQSRKTIRVTDMVSSKVWSQTHQTWQLLMLWSIFLVILFIGSLAVCISSAIRRAAEDADPIGTIESGTLPSSWRVWPAEWSHFLTPRAMALAPDGKTLWLCAAFQLLPLRRDSSTASASAIGAPLRLPSPVSGCDFVGSSLVVSYTSIYSSSSSSSSSPSSNSTTTASSSWASFEASTMLSNSEALLSEADSSNSLEFTLAQDLAVAVSSGYDLLPELKGVSSDLAGIFAGTYEADLWGLGLASTTEATPGAGILAGALRNASNLVLYSVSGLFGDPSTTALTNLGPRLSRALGLGIVRPRSMHFCVVGPCAANEPKLWIILDQTDRTQQLISVGLHTAEVSESNFPTWSSGSATAISLTGNSTHLWSLLEIGKGSAVVYKVVVASFTNLLKTASTEL